MKRLFLSLFFVLVFTMQAWGATYYVDNDAVDDSGDGSEGSPKKTIQAGIDLITSDGDILILDNDTWSNQDDLSVDGAYLGSITIQSKDSNATFCIIEGSTSTNPLLEWNENEVNGTFVGITFSNHTRSDGGNCFVANRHSVLKFQDCVFDNIDSTGGTGAIINFGRYAGDYGSNDVEFEGCLFQNCDKANVDENASTGWLINSRAEADLIWDGSTILSCTGSATGTGAMRGVIYVAGTLTMTGTNLFQDITTTTTTGLNNACIRCMNTGASVLAISGSTIFDNVDAISDTGDIGGVILVCAGGGTIDSSDGNLFEEKNCDLSTEGNAGQHIVTVGSSGALTITGPNFLIHDNTSTGDGGIIGTSQGGDMDITKASIYSNTVGNSGAFRFGGWAPSGTVSNCLIYDNVSTEGQGGGMLIMLQSAATADAVINLYNNVFYGNISTDADAGDSIHINSSTSTQDVTVQIKNCILWGRGESEVSVSETAGGNPIVSITHSNIRGGGDAVINVDTYTDNINSDPKFYRASSGEFMLRSTSPCIDQGTDVSITYDYLDYRIPNGTAPDMGAYEYYRKAYGSMHQSVCQKTSSTTLMTVESGLVNLDSTSGAMAIYLPPLELSRGLSFFLHRDNDGANDITVYANGNGETIGGAASKSLSTQYSTLMIYGGVDQWYCQPYTP